MVYMRLSSIGSPCTVASTTSFLLLNTNVAPLMPSPPRVAMLAISSFISLPFKVSTHKEFSNGNTSKALLVVKLPAPTSARKPPIFINPISAGLPSTREALSRSTSATKFPKRHSGRLRFMAISLCPSTEFIILSILAR